MNSSACPSEVERATARSAAARRAATASRASAHRSARPGGTRAMGGEHVARRPLRGQVRTPRRLEVASRRRDGARAGRAATVSRRRPPGPAIRGSVCFRDPGNRARLVSSTSSACAGTSRRRRGSIASTVVPPMAARAAGRNAWPRTAASRMSARSDRVEVVEPGRHERLERLGHGQPLELAEGAVRRRRPPRASRRSTSMRRVSTAYSGIPSARSRTRSATGSSAGPGARSAEELGHRRPGQRVELERRRHCARPAAQSGRTLEQGRPGERRHEDRPAVGGRLGEVLDEVEETGVGPVEVIEHEDRGGRVGDALEERPPGGERLLASAVGDRAETDEPGQVGGDPAALDVIRHVGRQAGGQSLSCEGGADRPPRSRPGSGPSRPAPRTRGPRRRPVSGPGARGIFSTTPSTYFLEPQLDPALADARPAR